MLFSRPIIQLNTNDRCIIIYSVFMPKAHFIFSNEQEHTLLYSKGIRPPSLVSRYFITPKAISKIDLVGADLFSPLFLMNKTHCSSISSDTDSRQKTVLSIQMQV